MICLLKNTTTTTSTTSRAPMSMSETQASTVHSLEFGTVFWIGHVLGTNLKPSPTPPPPLPPSLSLQPRGSWLAKFCSPVGPWNPLGLTFFVAAVVVVVVVPRSLADITSFGLPIPCTPIALHPSLSFNPKPNPTQPKLKQTTDQ